MKLKLEFLLLIGHVFLAAAVWLSLAPSLCLCLPLALFQVQHGVRQKGVDMSRGAGSLLAASLLDPFSSRELQASLESCLPRQ